MIAHLHSDRCPAAKDDGKALHECKFTRGHTGDHEIGDGTHYCACGLRWVQRTVSGGLDSFDLPPPIPVNASIEDQPPTDFDG